MQKNSDHNVITNKIRVLIIEDDPQIIKSVNRMLTSSRQIDFHVISFNRLSEGIDCLVENQMDVVLLDLMLPDSQGLDTLSRLISDINDTPIIVLTGLNDHRIAIEAVRKGAQDFVLKAQLEKDQLIQSIQFAIERKKSEKTLKNSQQNYQNLAETANDVILAFDLDGEIRYSNPAAQKIVGYTQAELLGMNISDIFAENQLNDAMEHLGNLTAGHQTFALFEGELLTKTGEVIPIEANSTIVSEFDNQSGFVIIGRDITQHKRALAAVSQSAKQLRNLLQKNSDGIVILDDDGLILFANEAAGRLLGMDSGELQGKYFGYDLDKTKVQDIEIKHTDGKRLTTEIRSVPTVWEGISAHLCSLHDVTLRTHIEDELRMQTQELKKTVQELRKANQQILEKQSTIIQEERLRVLLQLADQTFYDINQPLKTVMGGIESLKSGDHDKQSFSHHLHNMEAACVQISETLKRIELISNQRAEPEGHMVSCLLLNQEINILSVEDSLFSFNLLKGFLRHHPNISLHNSPSIYAATKVLQEETFDLIFVDYALTDGTGFDFLNILKEKSYNIPVIFITGKGNEMVASKALQAGAYEYLTKDTISKKSILDAISKALNKFTLTNELKMVQQKMADMSFRDEMTGLYNYRYFKDSLIREMSEAKRYKNDLVLCLLDLDHFKRVNDTYGHPVGDMVLKSVGELLTKMLRKSDISCRYGGEEFALILPHTNLIGAKTIVDRLRKALATIEFSHGESVFHITVSIGLVQYDRDLSNISVDQMVKKGDQALYEAKRLGRNQIVAYEDLCQI